MKHIRNRRSQEAVRWYVLTLPTAVGGRDNIYSSKGLDAELSRRKRCGEPLFEYFAPSYVEARKVGGKMVNTRKPLLYNYVFIHASENEIFRLKRIMPLYNLLPRVSVGEHSYFPYLSDHEMETLRWMAEFNLVTSRAIQAASLKAVKENKDTVDLAALKKGDSESPDEI